MHPILALVAVIAFTIRLNSSRRALPRLDN